MSDISDFHISDKMRAVLAETIGNLVIDLEIETIRRTNLQSVLDLVSNSMKQERGIVDEHVHE